MAMPSTECTSDIATDDIANILSRLDKEVYISQEVIYGAGEPVTPDMYTQNGDVQEYVVECGPPECMLKIV